MWSSTATDTGQPYELLILDAPSIEEAVNVWRWNVGGLGFSSNGYNGPYETAITADGQIVADFITSGTLVANIIKAGVLQSQDGSSYWDLETGEVVLRAYATTESVDKVSDRVGTIEEQKMYRLVISSSNGNIFKKRQYQTTLYATVFSWDENITDSPGRKSVYLDEGFDDPTPMPCGTQTTSAEQKSIEITSDDVEVRATFFCDLIDTTTRESSREFIWQELKERSFSMSKAQGQFTIIDYNDALTLTGYIGSNLAKTQMYNPDNNTYTPDWSDTNLVLTPSLYVIGTTTDQITSSHGDLC